MNPSMGISVPLTKRFWNLCYRNTKMAFSLPKKNIMKWNLILPE
jgi:hypothetical protein